VLKVKPELKVILVPTVLQVFGDQLDLRVKQEYKGYKEILGSRVRPEFKVKPVFVDLRVSKEIPELKAIEAILVYKVPQVFVV
jgi:hypothetical protein